MSLHLYPTNAPQKLGFDQIITRLYELCLSNLGQSRVETLEFATDADVVASRQAQAGAFAQILASDEHFPTDHYYDLSDPLELLSIDNSAIPKEELYKVMQVVRTVRDILTFFDKSKGAYPELEMLADQVIYDKRILKDLERVLDEEGEVKSSVSKMLKDIRKQINQKASELDKQFQRELEAAQRKGWLSEEGESIRHGRRVLAVSAVHKKQVRGYIHDESTTGKTLFIEPQATATISNEIFELRQEEKQEVYRILREVTDKIRPFREYLAGYQTLLAKLDFIRAKAMLGRELDAQQPIITKQPEIALDGAVHPMLYRHNQASGQRTVPLSLTLTPDKGILVISGPNAGGKSVAMKTMGLLQMMAQAGLLVPASATSRIGIFRSLFVDIGDDQSIENDLSTYSSHLRNMKYFTDWSDSHTLFLVDEMGTGTDPELGGPIAEAILEQLNEQQAMGIVTTHYTNLKLYATEQPRLENGSMIFDKETLTPTYELAVGTPGSSYSFEVARNIGFQDAILQKAEQKVKREYQQLDELLSELEKSQYATKQKDEQLARQQKQLDATLKKQKQLSDQLEKNKTQYLLESKENALNYLNQLNRQFENMIKEWRESEKAEKEEKRKEISKKIQQQRRHLEKDVANLQNQVAGTEKPGGQASPAIVQGTHVKLKGGKQTGIVDEVKGNKATVIFDNLRTETSLKDLQPAKQEKKERGTPKASFRATQQFDYQEKAREFRTTLDIRGKDKHEAMREVEQWLDKAVLLNERQLKVLHGKGSGVLRQAVRDKLQDFEVVKSCHSDYPEQGGEGVTLVELS